MSKPDVPAARPESRTHVADLRPVPRATYLLWAKQRPHPALDLARSDVPALRLDDLPGARASLDLVGRNDTGYPPLVAAIAARYGVAEAHVATATGASGANFLVCAALVRAGDDVVVESPGYDPLLAVPQLLGARTVRFERRFEDGFALNLDRVEAAITPRTRLIIITNPHNPTGVTSTTAEIQALGHLATRYGARVLVDEIYLDAAPGAIRAVAATLGEPFVTTSSLTKAYGLSSLRCGWALAAPPVAEEIRRTRDLVDGIGSVLAERASVVAFEHLPALAARARAILDPNLARLERFMAVEPRLAWVRPAGGPVAFPRLTSGEDARGFADRLLARHGAMVVPGHFFDAPPHFRIGFGIDASVLEQGLDAVSRALAEA